MSRAALSSASQSGNVAELEKALLTATKEDIADIANSGYTYLQYAAARGHTDAVQLLVKAGAELNKVTSSDKMTPLMYAAQNGHEAVVRVILKAWPDLTCKNSAGRNVLELAKTDEIRSLIKAYDGVPTQLGSDKVLITAQVAGVQARREWMQRRDALEAQYEAAEKALKFAECAKLWQDITAHEKLSLAMVPSVEDFKTLADRHKKLVAAVEAKCKELLAAEKFEALETMSLALKDLRAMDASKLIFPADAKVSAQPQAVGKPAAATANIVSTHTAKQAELATQLQDLRSQHQAIMTQATGVKEREEWTQRRAALQAKFDAAEKAEDFLECAKLGKDRVALDAEGSKLALSAELYKTLGERFAQLAVKHRALAERHQQAMVDLGQGRRELLAVKDFAGLEAMGQLLRKLQAMDLSALAPPPGVKLPAGAMVGSGSSVAGTPSPATSATTGAAASSAPTSGPATSEVKPAYSYTADPAMTKAADPVNSQTSDPKSKTKKEKCIIM